MDRESLLEGSAEIGCRLLGCGAEIYRVEDTVRRILGAYGVSGEVFAIPNCLIVSITDPDGHILTRMRRAEVQGTDLEALERYNEMSRRICANPPADTAELLNIVTRTGAGMKIYPAWLHLIGYFIGAAFFALFFYGGLAEALIAGAAGVAAGICVILLSRVRSNFFINTVVAGFALTFVTHGLMALGVPMNIEPVTVGAAMVLVPGLVFTNFMSDLLIGDMVAGVSTFAKAVLTAAAIALGTGAGTALFRNLFAVNPGTNLTTPWPGIVICIFALIACIGFCLPYNVHGIVGTLLCCIGGALGWGIYLIVQSFGLSTYISTLAASVVVAIYANVMARIRKCPVTPYLLISYFPLVPGYTLYKAMEYGTQGSIMQFLETFIRTFGIAGCIALGTLLVSTALRIIQSRRRSR